MDIDPEKLSRDLRDTIKRVLREYAETLALAIVLALILRIFVISAYRISNTTMLPTLRVGDFIVAYKLPYGFTIPFTEKKIGQPRPRRNDLLVFRCPHNPIATCIKRVVALPGDRVEIRKKKLIINGEAGEYRKLNMRLQDLVEPPDAYAVLRETLNGARRNIYVTDQNLNENYGPYIVPPGHFFALSDNRDDMDDSRTWGAVAFSAIEARALLTWFSVDWSPTVAAEPGGPRIRAERIFRWLD
jgi:signal peptidase I